jgi:hypothetical protein
VKISFLRRKQHLILLLVFIFYSIAIRAQVISKSLPEPKFYVLGVNLNDFPKFEGNWEDSSFVKVYGAQVQKWLLENEQYKKEHSASKKANVVIDHFFFKSLDTDEKAKFKIVSKQMGYALDAQKRVLKNDFDKSYPKNKGNVKNFYRDAEQVYFLHEENLILLKRAIKN